MADSLGVMAETTLVSMGRKNGKTGTASALALAHLAGPEAIPGGQILSGAADRAQAAIVYEAMKAMALASPDLADRIIFRDFKKEAEEVETGSTYRALSSDARKAHGLSGSLFVADELAQWRGRDLGRLAGQLVDPEQHRLLEFGDHAGAAQSKLA